MKYISSNDLLRKELKGYYQFCKEKLGYISSVEDLFNFDLSDEELLLEDDSLDGDSEILYDMINKYINLDASSDFDVQINTNQMSSINLKLLLVVQLYEYVLSNYDLSTMEERNIFDTLIKNLSMEQVIKLYNTNYQTILNLYCMIVLDNFDNKKIIESRQEIIKNNKVDDILKINPASILDYRFLFGCKFEEEELESVLIGQKLIEIVDILIEEDNRNLEDKYLKESIHSLLEENPQVSMFIENNQNYIISNIYEHLLQKKNLDIVESQYIETLENKELLEFLNLFFKMEDNLEFLLHAFYSFNHQGINENKLLFLRKNTKSKGKIKVIEKVNPYYIEENNYFKNK